MQSIIKQKKGAIANKQQQKKRPSNIPWTSGSFWSSDTAVPGAPSPAGSSAIVSETESSTSAGPSTGAISSEEEDVAAFKRLASRNARSAPMSF